VTVTWYVPRPVPLLVNTVKIELADPPLWRVTFAGFRLIESPDGLAVENMETVPANPFRLAMARVDVPEEPRRIVRLEGLAEMEKSGGGDWEILKTTFAECVRLPLVPVTVMFPEVPAVPPIISSVANAVPPGVRLTLEGVIDHTVHPGVGHRGEGDVWRLTVPLKLFRLVRVIVELPWPPDERMTVVGFAEMEKSGFDDTIVNATFTLWDTPPLEPVTVTMYVFGGEPRTVKNKRVALAVPPDGSTTWVGVTPQLGQDAQSGGADVESVIVPLNPFTLDSKIVEVAFAPAGTFWLDGFAEIVNSDSVLASTVRAPLNWAVMKPPPSGAVPVRV
jgi:hypothetical protein